MYQFTNLMNNFKEKYIVPAFKNGVKVLQSVQSASNQDYITPTD